jgi:polyhydroxyalkanoate synthesis repressor PhaR
MAEPRVIKRYANRKLYDTQRSRYVTLEQIRDMIKAGEEVQIVDNTSKEDLTAVTLAQIIFEEEKRTSFLPLTALQNIIQSGGQSIQSFATNAGEKVRGIFRRNQDGTIAEGQEGDEQAESTDAPPKQSLRDFLERSQATFDEWQKKVDERIRHAVESVQPWSSLEKELRSLTQRLGELEKKLDERD